MTEVMDNLFYTKDHEWAFVDEEGFVFIGITDYAQETLGDITYIELLNVGEEVEQQSEFASIESVKAASDIFSPVSGIIIEVNTILEDTPEIINKSCYDKGMDSKN